MRESFASADAFGPTKPPATTDDGLTIVAITIVSEICSALLHEGVGHGLTALLTGANSGLLTTLAWSSVFDSRLVEAGGTLVNLAAALVLWLALRMARSASLPARYFLLLTCAFNLFTGTGYFLFSGMTDFGDWAAVIRDLHPHFAWRIALVVLGAASYYAAARIIGIGLVRYVGIPRNSQKRLRKLTLVPYFASVGLSVIAGVLNPIGIGLVFLSALPATAGGHSGLLWLQYQISGSTTPKQPAESLNRNYSWVIAAVVLGLLFVVVLGRGINLHR